MRNLKDLCTFVCFQLYLEEVMQNQMTIKEKYPEYIFTEAIIESTNLGRELICYNNLEFYMRNRGLEIKFVSDLNFRKIFCLCLDYLQYENDELINYLKKE